jgi:hypothetical protein
MTQQITFVNKQQKGQKSEFVEPWVYNTIRKAYDGTKDLTINVKNLLDSEKDGTLYKGCFEDLRRLQYYGYFKEIIIGKATKGEYGFYTEVTLTNFDPTIEVSFKSGKKYNFFKDLIKVYELNKRIQELEALTLIQETKAKRKSA